MEAEIKIILDKRNKSKKIVGGYSVGIRVTFDRQPRVYSTGKVLTPSDFIKVMGDKPRGVHKETRKYLDRQKAKAVSIVEKLQSDFTFEEFKTLYKGNKNSLASSSVYVLFESVAMRLEEQERIKTASSYRTALNAFKRYKPKLYWKDITVNFLTGFERKSIEKGRSKTTVGIYMRSLRKIVNDAIDLGYMDKSKYPFGKKGYVIPKGTSIKKALTKEDVNKLANYQSRNLSEMKARDLWLFSYLCNGMNVTDIVF